MNPLRTYVVFAALGFRRYSAYRLATAAGAFTNSVFGLLRAPITMAVIGAAGGELAGYGALEGATYAWLTQAVLTPVNVWTWNELALRIRSGDIAVDLARPVDLQMTYLAGDLGRAAFQVLPRGLPPLLVGALVTGLALPTTVLPYVLGLIALALGVCVSFACRWLVNLAAFWLVELRGVLTLHMVAVGALSGLTVPVHWFPDWLARIASASPFPSMVQAPVDLLAGRVQGVEALGVIGVQVAWFLGVLLLGRVVLARGVRRLVVQGG